MKKNLFFYVFAVLCSVSIFTACSDDEETPVVPGQTTTISDQFVGKYKGVLDVKMVLESGQEAPLGTVSSQMITVTKAGDAAVNMQITNFSFVNLDLGTIDLKDCQLVDAGNGAYTFTATSNLDKTGLLAARINASGRFSNGKLALDLDIDEVAVGGNPVNYTVKVTYEGDQLTGNESSEAKILSFVFDREVAEVDSLVVVQPTIDEATKTISFMVADTAKAEYLKALVPTVEVSDKATVTPASGEAQDFSNGKVVTYTVTAEDGTVAEYKVSIAGSMAIYDFEDWTAGVEGQAPDMTFYNPTGWCSSNAGAQMLKSMNLTDSYVVMETDDAHSGEKAALIKSIDTKGMDMFIAKVPKVTTGSLFLGNFLIDISSTLKSTKFGIPYDKKPLSLKGWYKYTPGPEYYIVNEEPYDQHCHEAVLDETKTDEFMISVVLYETDEYDTSKWTDCLTGVADAERNIYNSSRVAAIAQLTGGEQADWKEFNLELEWKKEYNADTNYRMAIICSSSKDGDKFWGAPESTLIVDDFELVSE